MADIPTTQTLSFDFENTNTTTKKNVQDVSLKNDHAYSSGFDSNKITGNTANDYVNDPVNDSVNNLANDGGNNHANNVANDLTNNVVNNFANDGAKDPAKDVYNLVKIVGKPVQSDKFYSCSCGKIQIKKPVLHIGI